MYTTRIRTFITQIRKVKVTTTEGEGWGAHVFLTKMFKNELHGPANEKVQQNKIS